MQIDTSKQMPDSARIASPNRRDGPTAATEGVRQHYDLVPPADSQTTKPITGARYSEVVLGAKRPRDESLPGSFRASQLRRSALYEDCPRRDPPAALAPEQNGHAPLLERVSDKWQGQDLPLQTDNMLRMLAAKACESRGRTQFDSQSQGCGPRGCGPALHHAGTSSGSGCNDSRVELRPSDDLGSGSGDHTRLASATIDPNRTAYEDSCAPTLVASTTTVPTTQPKDRRLPVLPRARLGQHALDPHLPQPETQPMTAAVFPPFSRLATCPGQQPTTAQTAAHMTTDAGQPCPVAVDAVSAAATESFDAACHRRPAPPPLRTQPSDSVSVQLGSALPPEVAARLKKKIRIIQPISKAWEEETLQSSSTTAHTSSGSGGGASGSGTGDATTVTAAKTSLERLAASTQSPSTRKLQQPHHQAGRREHAAAVAKSATGTWTSVPNGSTGAGAASGETCAPTPSASGAARSLELQGSIVSGRLPLGAVASQLASRRQETADRVAGCDAGCLSVSIVTEEDGVGHMLVGRTPRGGSQMGALHPPQARTVAAVPPSSSQLSTRAAHNVVPQLREPQALPLPPDAAAARSGKGGEIITPMNHTASVAAGTTASAVAPVLTVAADAVPPLLLAEASAAGFQRPTPVLGAATSAAKGGPKALLSSRRSAATPQASHPQVLEATLSVMQAPAAAQAAIGVGGHSGPATAAPQAIETARAGSTREVVRPSASALMGPEMAQQEQLRAAAAARAASGLTDPPPRALALGSNGPACAATRPPYTSRDFVPAAAGAGPGGSGGEPRGTGLAPPGMPMPTGSAARPMSGVCLGKVQGELTLLYHWYVANKAAYLDQAQRQLRRVEELTAAHQRECEGSGAGGSGEPLGAGAAAARVESAEAARAFETALKIMRVCDSVEQQWLPPQQRPSQVVAEAAPCGGGAAATADGGDGAAAAREYRRAAGGGPTVHAPQPSLPRLDRSAGGISSAALDVGKAQRASTVLEDPALPCVPSGSVAKSVPAPGGEWSHGPRAALAVAAALMSSVARNAGIEAATGRAPAGADKGGGDGGTASVEADLNRHGPGGALQSAKGMVSSAAVKAPWPVVPQVPGAGTMLAPVFATRNQPTSV